MSKRKQEETVYDDGSYIVKKSKKANIIAFVLCVLFAFVIWLYATNMESDSQEEHPVSGTAFEWTVGRSDTVL